MSKWILAGALVTFTAVPAQAHHGKVHHHERHHAHAAAALAYPDSVTLDGKEYKVCKPGFQDDCVQPRDAGLRPARTAPHR